MSGAGCDSAPRSWAWSRPFIERWQPDASTMAAQNDAMDLMEHLRTGARHGASRPSLRRRAHPRGANPRESPAARALVSCGDDEDRDRRRRRRGRVRAAGVLDRRAGAGRAREDAGDPPGARSLGPHAGRATRRGPPDRGGPHPPPALRGLAPPPGAGGARPPRGTVPPRPRGCAGPAVPPQQGADRDHARQQARALPPRRSRRPGQERLPVGRDEGRDRPLPRRSSRGARPHPRRAHGRAARHAREPRPGHRRAHPPPGPGRPAPGAARAAAWRPRTPPASTPSPTPSPTPTTWSRPRAS